MSKIKLVVFDMDGVIVDSEPLHHRAKEILLADHGVEDIKDLSATVGLPNEAFWARIIEDYHLSSEPDEMVLLQNNLILSMMDKLNIGMMPGLQELLKTLSSKGIQIGLASSSVRYFVQKVLDRLGISHYFRYLVTGDEVKERKPFPECYLKAMALFEASPHESIAIEDSTSGIRAAVSAGMTAIGLINPGSGKQDLSKAHHVVNHLTQIIPLIEAD